MKIKEKYLEKEQYKKQQNHHGIKTNGLRRSEIESNSNLKKKNGNITKPMEIWKENIETRRTSLLKIRGKKKFLKKTNK